MGRAGASPTPVCGMVARDIYMYMNEHYHTWMAAVLINNMMRS